MGQPTALRNHGWSRLKLRRQQKLVIHTWILVFNLFGFSFRCLFKQMHYCKRISMANHERSISRIGSGHLPRHAILTVIVAQTIFFWHISGMLVDLITLSKWYYSNHNNLWKRIVLIAFSFYMKCDEEYFYLSCVRHGYFVWQSSLVWHLWLSSWLNHHKLKLWIGVILLKSFVRHPHEWRYLAPRSNGSAPFYTYYIWKL